MGYTICVAGKVSYIQTAQKEGGSSTSYETYDGSYEVIPQAFRTPILNTSNKLLTQDVVVAEIPYSVTQNNSGGNTVHIAKEM
ncbi:MAG: hypothetical protein R3Y53_00795 [Bacillota bacterium]